MPINKSRKKSGEYKAKNSEWDEAIADAKERIRKLRYTIRVFQTRKKAGDRWPISPAQD